MPVAPVQARSKATYVRILTAAGKLLEHEGAAQITVQKVADAAGVDARLVRYYFDDLEGLMVVIAKHAVSRWSKGFRLMLAGHDDPRDAIADVSRSMWKLLTRPGGALRRQQLVVQEIRLGASRNEALQPLPRRAHQEVETAWKDLFYAASDRYDFAVPPETLGRMLYDSWDGIVTDYLTTGDSARAHDVLEGFITAFSALITPRRE